MAAKSKEAKKTRKIPKKGIRRNLVKQVTSDILTVFITSENIAMLTFDQKGQMRVSTHIGPAYTLNTSGYKSLCLQTKKYINLHLQSYTNWSK